MNCYTNGLLLHAIKKLHSLGKLIPRSTMDPGDWFINLFSNRDDKNALFGDVYVKPTTVGLSQEDDQELHDDDDTILEPTVAQDELFQDDETDEDVNEDDDEVVAPRFEDDDIVLEEKDDDDASDEDGAPEMGLERVAKRSKKTKEPKQPKQPKPPKQPKQPKPSKQPKPPKPPKQLNPPQKTQGTKQKNQFPEDFSHPSKKKKKIQK